MGVIFTVLHGPCLSVASMMHRQLMCVARGILRDSKIVILDDSARDVDVLDVVKTNFTGNTVIYMSRNIHGLLDCDRS